jgi:hypothetical protein
MQGTIILAWCELPFLQKSANLSTPPLSWPGASVEVPAE